MNSIRSGRMIAYLVAAIAMATAPLQAATYHVTTDGVDGANDGLNWGSAYATIGYAVGKATTAGDVVMVSNGTYEVSTTITITDGITVRSTNGWAVTTVDANGSTNRCFSINNSAATVSGFTITGSKLDSRVPSYWLAYGGGAYLYDGTVTNCLIRNNTVGGYGGGVYMLGGKVVDCTLSGNSGIHGNWGHGGGVAVAGAGVVENCTIVSNAATGGMGAPYGGGVTMTGGTLRNCTVAHNVHTTRYGGGVGMSGGAVDRCVIRNNASTGNGGGVYETGGLLVNSVVCDNRLTATTYGGGGVGMTAGQVVNCTVVGNDSFAGGGGIAATGGVVTNSIFYGNTSLVGGQGDVYAGGGTVCYSWASPALVGAGNQTGVDPGFIDFVGGDYGLLPGSPCLDSGTNVVGMDSDLLGAPRPRDGDGDGTERFDMGAYEAGAGSNGALRCAFYVSTNTALISLDAVFTASVAGSNRNVTSYNWVFGDTATASGAGLLSVSHTYASGWFTVSLTVTNDAGEGASYARSLYIRVAPAAVYVVTDNPGATSPYDTWAKATTNLQTAIDVAGANSTTGTVVTVSNGTYRIANTLSISKGITMQSANGREVTILDANGDTNRCFSLGHSGAVLAGFTLTGVNADTRVVNYHFYYGGGVYMSDGMVTNCLIHGNKVGGYGGGVYMLGGTLADCVVSNNAGLQINYGAGAGICLLGGVVENCTITANTAPGGHTGATPYGGGVRMLGGTLRYSTIMGNTHTRANGGGIGMSGGVLDRCTIRGNEAVKEGGGVYMTGGSVVNCLVDTNVADTVSGGNTGGGIRMTAGSVLNCTIVRNSCYGAGGGLAASGGTMTNSIVYGNTSLSVGNGDTYIGGGVFGYNWSIPVLTGTSNLTGTAPGFTDFSGGDFALLAGSPCVDSGVAIPGMTTDLVGTTRPLDGDGVGDALFDMGAYEALDAGSGPLGCSFSAPAVQGMLSLQAVFTASLSGTDQTVTHYHWDFGDGATATGPDLGTVTNTYGIGWFDVSLTVSNASDETAGYTNASYIRVAPAVAYVSAASASPTLPYDTWAKAATDLQSAIDAGWSDGSTNTLVLVTNGVYEITGADIAVLEGLTVRSVNGPDVTTVRRTAGTERVFRVGNTNALLTGFTITGGNTLWPTYGGGVTLAAGTVTDCVIVGNAGSHGGGGVYVTGGRVSNCVITNNRATQANYGNGGGAYLAGGQVENCIIAFNTGIGTHSGGQPGGGVRIDSGTLRNCLVHHNTHTAKGGGGVGMGGGVVENCTVADNTSALAGGGVAAAGGTATNTIVYGNNATSGADDIDGTTGFGYSCSPDLVHDPGGTGNINTVPLFVDVGAADYRLQAGSAGVNAGILQAWMTSAARDLAGLPRAKGAPDMGAYELQPPGGTVVLLR